MKAVVVSAIVALMLAVPMLTLGGEAYTIVPAGGAGPGLFFDQVGPLLDGSGYLPIVDRLPRIARQPLWATYEIGEPITGGCRLYDHNDKLVRTSSIIVELYRLRFYRVKAYYELIYREKVRCDVATGIYRFSIPTDGLEAAFYQVRLGLPNGANLDPEFRIQIGDAVFTNDVPPPGYEGGCGCGG
jgi:hypothetical protein